MLLPLVEESRQMHSTRNDASRRARNGGEEHMINVACRTCFVWFADTVINRTVAYRTYILSRDILKLVHLLTLASVYDTVECNKQKGGTVTTATATPKLFRNQRKHDPDSECAQAIRDTYWTMFGHYAFPGFDVDDFDATVTQLQLATGWHKGFVKNAILGLSLIHISEPTRPY